MQCLVVAQALQLALLHLAERDLVLHEQDPCLGVAIRAREWRGRVGSGHGRKREGECRALPRPGVELDDATMLDDDSMHHR